MSRHETDPFLDPGADDAELLASLRAAHRAPSPSPVFVSTLRGELMAQATTIKPKTPVGVPRPKGFQQLAAPLTAPTRRDRSNDRRWISLELAAIAALLLAFLGTSLAGGPNGVLNALRQSPADSTLPGALYRGDNARTGIMPEPGPRDLPAILWRKQLTNANFWPSLATSGRVYLVDDEGGRVQAVSTETGMPIWEATVGRMEGFESIAIGNDSVYVSTAGQLRGGSDPGYLIALDQGTGKERWRYETGGTSGSSPAVDGDRVYVLALDNSLRVVDAKSGAEEWRYDLNSATPSAPEMATAMASGTPESSIANVNHFLSDFSPAIANGMIYLTANDGVLYAIDLKRHEAVWRFQTDGNVLETPAIVNGTLLLSSTLVQEETDGITSWMYALDAATGAESWRWQTSDYIDLVAATAQTVYLTANDQLATFTITDGAQGWTVPGGFFAPIMTGDTLYLLDSTGTINAYDPANGQLRWSAYTAGQMPITAGGRLIMRDGQGSLLAIGAGPGTPISAVGTPSATPEADLSGQPACDAPAPKANTIFEGTPTASLVPERKWEHIGQPADALPSDIPVGDPVGPEVEGEILRTLRQMVNCRQDGRAGDLSGFYSDDFLRRVWVAFSLSHNPDNLRWWLPMDVSYDSIRLLPDGRVGVLWMTSDQYGGFDIFVKVGDRWVLDEKLAVVPVLGGVG